MRSSNLSRLSTLSDRITCSLQNQEINNTGKTKEKAKMTTYLALFAIINFSTIFAKVDCRPHGSFSNSSEKIWALLVAGSSGYSNYRHQADIAHAYQMLTLNGIPEENIIVMMADDVPYSESNPTPGILVNEPDGWDVYDGVKVDYDGDFVTPKNFLNVLSGNKTAMNGIGTGRVIESGPDDFVFVNFDDHGSPGLLGFPRDVLHVKDLYRTLKSMSEQNKFKKMGLYIEACYSGSLFDKILGDDLNIFAMTAADPYESSYACYYDPLRETYVGDEFSVNWLEHAEMMPLEKKSLHNLFAKVRTNTTNSHVQEYGDLDAGSLKLSKFFNENPTGYYSSSDIRKTHPKDAVKSEDVPLAILQKKILKASKSNDAQVVSRYTMEIQSILDTRNVIDKSVDQILLRIVGENNDKVEEIKRKIIPIDKNNMDCCAKISDTYFQHCFHFSENPYVGKVLYPLLNMCSLKDITTVDKVVETIKSVCSNYI